MRFPLNLLTMALLGLSGSAMAADFSVNRANTDKVNTSGFQCRQCQLAPGLSGEVTANAGYNDSDDIHSGNALGDGRDGMIASVDAELGYRSQGGYRSQLRAMIWGWITASSVSEPVAQVSINWRWITAI